MGDQMSRHSIKPCDRHNYCSTKHKTESYKKKKKNNYNATSCNKKIFFL